MITVLQLFVLGCCLTIIIKLKKGQDISLSELIIYGLVLAVLFPLAVLVLWFLNILLTEIGIVGVAAVMVAVAIFIAWIG